MEPQNGKDKINIISEKTLIPLSLVLIVGAFIVAFTTLSNSSASTEARLNRFVEFQGKRNDVLEKIDQRLSRIEGRLGIPESK